MAPVEENHTLLSQKFKNSKTTLIWKDESQYMLL